MFLFEKYFSLWSFAIGWGLLITVDFVLRMFGLAGYHGIQTGVILPIASPIMSVLVIFSFIYFVFTKSADLGKKFYASCNFLMLIVITLVLLTDFALRFFAFNQTYCRGMDSEAFAACKDEHRDTLWLDILKLACALRMMFYSTQVLEQLRDRVAKESLFDNEKGLL